MTYIERHLEKKILELSKYYSVIMVCGQRQVGKSTMLYHIKEKARKYVTLDDAKARRLALTDPVLFFQTYTPPLLIDEVERVPEILIELKRIVDEKNLKGEDASGMYWLTSSQKFKMMDAVSDSLAGRIAVLDMSSLATAEIEKRTPGGFNPELDELRKRMESYEPKNVHEIYERIFRGGMPKLIATPALDRERFYMDYINTYLERDIKELSQVGKLGAFYDFLVVMAARTGQELHYEDIAKSIGVTGVTVKNWISILERSGIIYILRPYFSNITNRLVKTPKVYFLDTGLAAYLCRWPSAETIEKGAMDGAFLETYVIAEVVKSFYNAGKPLDLYYYRDKKQKEIDLLIVRGNKAYPIEVKKSSIPNKADKNFNALEGLKLDVQPGIIMCMSEEFIPYNRESWLFPIGAL